MEWEMAIARQLIQFGAAESVLASIAPTYAHVVIAAWEYLLAHGEGGDRELHGASEADIALIQAAMLSGNERREWVQTCIRVCGGGVPIPRLVGQITAEPEKPRLIWNNPQSGRLILDESLLEGEANDPGLEERKTRVAEGLRAKIREHNRLV